MGKEWLYWGGASNSTKKRRSSKGDREMEEASVAPGCMCAVFHLLDLHHLRFTLPHQAPPPLCRDSGGALFQDDTTGRKGVEAPRNSLELNEGILEAASSSLIMKHEENLNIPVGIRIRTSCDTKSPRASTSSCRGKREDTSSECSGSPGTKSPNLVARLMGLDLLPENGSPSFSSSRLSTSTSSTSSNMHFQSRNPSRHVTQTRSNSMNSYSFYNRDASGTYSLPETPRISSARKSDVDHHRLSLQILKENVNNGADVSNYGAKKMSRNRGVNLEQENMNAIDYARSIVKQVKEKVSRRAGVDITNTIRSRNDNNLVLKPNKQSAILRRLREEDSCSTTQSTPSCSPRLSFLDTKKKLEPTSVTSTSKIHDPTSTKGSQDSVLAETIPQVQKPMVLPVAHPQVQLPDKSSNQDKPVQTSRLRSRQGFDSIRNKKEEPFIRSMAANKSNVSDKKSKRTPLSNELLNISGPSLLLMRKDDSLPVALLRNKQSATEESDAPQLKRSTQKSSFPSHSYKQERFEQDNIRSNCTSSNNSLKESEQHRYIQRILKRIGIDKATPLSLAKWYSPAHPLDPSIFHYLELFHPTIASKLNPSCQRKLIFHLVDEFLVEILRPDVKFNSWGVTKRDQLCREELIDTLCKKVGEFPEANCEVLEDIDELVNMDFERSKLGRSDEFEDEAECIAMSIERDIVGKLLHETVMMVYDMGVRT